MKKLLAFLLVSLFVVSLAFASECETIPPIDLGDSLEHRIIQGYEMGSLCGMPLVSFYSNEIGEIPISQHTAYGGTWFNFQVLVPVKLKEAGIGKTEWEPKSNHGVVVERVIFDSMSVTKTYEKWTIIPARGDVDLCIYHRTVIKRGTIVPELGCSGEIYDWEAFVRYDNTYRSVMSKFGAECEQMLKIIGQPEI